MPIAISNLTTNSSTTDATSYNTASVAPASGSLIIVTVVGVAAPNVFPTLSGHSLTWDVVETVGGAGTDITARVMRTFKAVSAGVSGALTIDWGSTTQSRCFWSVTEITGLPDASNGIIQSVKSIRDNGGGAISTYSVTLDTFSKEDNVTYGAIHNSGVSAITPGTDFTELGDTTQDTQVLQTEYKLVPDTSVDWSFVSGDNEVLAIALEIGSAGNTGSFFMIL